MSFFTSIFGTDNQEGDAGDAEHGHTTTDEKRAPPPQMRDASADTAFITRGDMMKEMAQFQKKMEQLLQAERNKRVQRNQKLAGDLTKRLAEFEGKLNTGSAAGGRPALPPGAAITADPSSADLERLAASLAQKEPRLAALVDQATSTTGFDEPRGTPRGMADRSTIDDTQTIVSMSGVSDTSIKMADTTNKILLLEELKSKVERLEKGSKKLVAAAAEALTTRRSTDDAGSQGPESASNSVVDYARGEGKVEITDEGTLAEQFLLWNQKLTRFEVELARCQAKVDKIDTRMATLEDGTKSTVNGLVEALST